ncbi:hypothetical protein BH24GEM2_BH24GEM2_13790 [soil metagenome]
MTGLEEEIDHDQAELYAGLGRGLWAPGQA